jgi:receptor protein-tyrosine kinase
LFSAAWRHRWLVIVTTLIALVLGVAYSILRPPKTAYTAKASLVVQTSGGGLDLGSSGSPERFVSNQVEILRSDSVILDASAIASEQDPPVTLTRDDYLQGLEVDASPTSDLVDVVFTYLDDADAAVAGANAIVEAYRDLMTKEKNAASSSALARIDAELATLDDEAQAVAAEITDTLSKDPTYTELRSEYEDALSEIGDLQAEAKTADAARLDEIRARLSDLRNVITTYQSILTIGTDDPELETLRNEQDQIATRREALVERRDTITVDVELSPDVVAFSSPARFATAAADSGPARILSVAFLVGLLAGVGLAYLTATRKRVFHDRMEPEQILGAPLLADIPAFGEEGLKTLLPVRDEPRSASAEAFRFAAASLELRMNRQGFKSLVIISPTLGAGKSTVLANVAIASARQGNKVLAVDADFGNQALTRFLAGDEGTIAPGLTEVVTGGLSIEQATRVIEVAPGLVISLLSRGAQPVAAADLLRSPGARSLFVTAKDEYDVILVDAPPLLQVAYASTLAGLVDTVLVLVPHKGLVAQLAEARDRLGFIAVPVLGYLYNASPLRREMTVSEGSTADVLGDLGGAGRGNADRGKKPWS